MKNILNGGVLGYGFMGQAHTFGYQTMQLYYDHLPFSVNLAAVYTRNPEKGLEATEKMGFDYYSGNADDIINDPSIDIIDICTPNSLHKEELIKCIKAGKNVYCEKPMVLSIDEAQEVKEALRKYNYSGTAQIVFHNRFFPTSLRAKELIDAGRLGKILSFRASYLNPGASTEAAPATWRYQADIAGRGTLYDLGSHILDLLSFLLGQEFSSVMASSQIAFPARKSVDGQSTVRITVDDATYLIMKLKEGAVGTVECSKLATGSSDEMRYEIHGTKGALRYNSMSPNYLYFYDASVPDAMHSLGGDRGWKAIECVQHYPAPGGSFPHARSSIGWLRGHVHSLYSFCSNVYHGRPGTPSIDDGIYIQHVMDCAARSAEEKQWVDI